MKRPSDRELSHLPRNAVLAVGRVPIACFLRTRARSIQWVHPYQSRKLQRAFRWLESVNGAAENQSRDVSHRCRSTSASRPVPVFNHLLVARPTSHDAVPLERPCLGLRCECRLVERILDPHRRIVRLNLENMGITAVSRAASKSLAIGSGTAPASATLGEHVCGRSLDRDGPLGPTNRIRIPITSSSNHQPNHWFCEPRGTQEPRPAVARDPSRQMLARSRPPHVGATAVALNRRRESSGYDGRRNAVVFDRVRKPIKSF